jgi:hypothetical protein
MYVERATMQDIVSVLSDLAELTAYHSPALGQRLAN